MADDVPGPLSDAYDQAANGERFWRGDRAEEAARWLAGQGLAILGGEIYERYSVGWATYLASWDADEDDEAGLRTALEAIRRPAVLVGDACGPPDQLRFFFATLPA
jgi:hypothetical protein